ncbi:hypothetical protein Tery_2548 [Trichodesmium erythraeum IMS101]|uniref:DUF4058 domain-containing protein n=1 Tax=Trichodesmium erythraeum (strain IMS101) TaxID=203124 RepID=Q111S5_TRIEI|nr:DUF4058 family protein [Trichodesmium erythraeum GBRTRLIN201]MCH2050715.1 DUF4058 family protein [Trichodesmium sp. ALOHA_ZT_67]
MPNPFPGMNPYLEQPELWPEFHNQLVAAIARMLTPQLLPKYQLVTDKWVYQMGNSKQIVISQTDVNVQKNQDNSLPLTTKASTPQPFSQPIIVTIPMGEELEQDHIEVKDTTTNEVVTIIEVISFVNKKGEGRNKYETRRKQFLESRTHLVEIDLLREGELLPSLTSTKSHYRILISPYNIRPIAELYPFNLSDPIPQFSLPLLAGDTQPIVDLQTLVNELYEQLGYEHFIGYSDRPPLPWSVADVLPFVKGMENRQ